MELWPASEKWIEKQGSTPFFFLVLISTATTQLERQVAQTSPRRNEALSTELAASPSLRSIQIQNGYYVSSMGVEPIDLPPTYVSNCQAAETMRYRSVAQKQPVASILKPGPIKINVMSALSTYQHKQTLFSERWSHPLRPHP